MGEMSELLRFKVGCVLPEEILWEILARLPVKSLLRFKSLRRSWCKIIEDPIFSHLQLKQSSSRDAHLTFVDYNCQKERYCISLCSLETYSVSHRISIPCEKISKKWFSIAGSCNGVLCLNSFWHCNKTVSLFNPATRELKILPNVDEYGYNPEFGFGFDKEANDYKLVCVSTGFHGWPRLDYETRFSIVHVYSLSSDSWRRVDNFEGGVIESTFSCSSLAILLRGKVHWIGERIHKKNNNGEVIFIMVFDIIKEAMSEIMFPNDLGSVPTYFIDLSVFKDSLSVIDSRGQWFDIWYMSGNGDMKSWVKLMTIRPNLRNNDCLVNGYIGQNFEFIISDGWKDLYLYDSRCGTKRKLQTPLLERDVQPRYTYPYNRSLVAVGGNMHPL